MYTSPLLTDQLLHGKRFCASGMKPKVDRIVWAVNSRRLSSHSLLQHPHMSLPVDRMLETAYRFNEYTNASNTKYYIRHTTLHKLVSAGKIKKTIQKIHCDERLVVYRVSATHFCRMIRWNWHPGLTKTRNKIMQMYMCWACCLR